MIQFRDTQAINTIQADAQFGSVAAADDRTYELPMNPQIVVESTVEIYYLSPAAEKVALPDREERAIPLRD